MQNNAGFAVLDGQMRRFGSASFSREDVATAFAREWGKHAKWAVNIRTEEGWFVVSPWPGYRGVADGGE